MDPSSCLQSIAEALGDRDLLEAQTLFDAYTKWIEAGNPPGELRGVCGLSVHRVFGYILGGDYQKSTDYFCSN